MKLRKIGTSKKGVEDTFFIIVFLIGFALFFMILAKVWGSMKPQLDIGLSSSTPNSSSVNVSEILNTTSSTTTFFDKMFPFLLLGIIGFVLISGSFVFEHPIMLVVGIILLGVAILLAVVYANIYNNITTTDEFSDTKASFAITDKFLKYLPYLVFIAFIGIGVILWVRRGGGGTGI